MKSRAKIYITRQIPQKAIDILLQQCNVSMWDSSVPVPRGELLNNVQGVDALLCMSTDSIDSDVLDSAGPNLKVIGTVSDDCTHIDVEECQDRDIQIMKLPQISMETVAELAISLLMEATQKWTGLKENGKENNNCENGQEICSHDFSNNTLGIIGLGELGIAVAKGLRSLGISRIIYSDPWREIISNDVCVESVNIDKLLAEADIVCVCCKEFENSNNRIVLQSNSFKKMKNSAILINAGSGHVINYQDLYLALREEDIKAAGLLRREQGRIPYSDPLFCLHNCFFTNFKECDKIWNKASKCYEHVATNIVKVLQKREEKMDPIAEFAR